MEKGQISAGQFFVLLFGYLLGTSFFFLTGELITTAKQDAWIVPLWAGTAGVIMSFIWLKLANHYPGLTIVQICTQAAGKGIGGLIALLYIGYFVHLSALVTRNLGDYMKQSLLTQTPITIIHVMFLLIICYAVGKGIETIARATQILIPIFTLTLLFIIIFSLSEWNWDRFQGMFQMNVWATMKETRSILGFPYMEAIVFMMLFPFVRSKIKRNLVFGVVLTTIFLSATVLFIIGVLGVTRATHSKYPFFLIVQEIHIGGFEQMESTISLVLLIAVFIKLSITYYAAVLGLCQLFRVNNRSWLAISLILLISGLSLGFNNVLENIVWTNRFYFEYMLFFAIIFPSLLLFMTWMKQSKGKQKEGSKL
ncbi:spore germination protein KB [Paenibacillus anaericanus]|uniref:GerAB/ArcD/ProY family transporter n=1 Tax=Paenibacillus anaericanus TaxID=170367 RepID=UPI0027893CB3|nr:endospore germination permease [Paenibacillus anaericanus]MDQ0088864.1 spore germination protein KB [Paenibacillus anaericanus]